MNREEIPHGINAYCGDLRAPLRKQGAYCFRRLPFTKNAGSLINDVLIAVTALSACSRRHGWIILARVREALAP